MIESSISRRYAKALVDSAQENNSLDATLSQLANLKTAVLLPKVDLLEVLGNRFMDLKARLKVVDELAQVLGLSQEVKNFTKILIEKGRISLLPNIYAAFREYVFTFQNKVEIELVSARALKEGVVKEIQQKMETLLQKQIVVKEAIKPQVLGGVCVRVADQIFDGTLLSQIQKLGSEMKKQVGWN
jgi:F-type H+-transporting ATPase subunit delta